MAYSLMWISLTILTRLFTCASLEISSDDKELSYKLPHQSSYSSLWWHPHYSLKPYRSFQDAKVYVLNIPEYTSQMRLSFVYQGMYLHSHKPCNNSISVLLQHGSPAIPYKDEIHTDSWLYDNADYYNTTVSLDQPHDESISSPLPGKWYVTAFLPYVDKEKKIKEKGLSTPDEKCLSALLVKQVLANPLKPPVVLAKGQPWKSAANIRFPTSKYYKYFVSSYSKKLRVHVNNVCNVSRYCSLKLSLSAKRLPTNSSLSCMAPCVLDVTWPQPHSYYYIEVSGTSHSYEITANHTECLPETPGCTEIITMSSLDRKLLTNSWQFYLFNETSTFSLELTSDYVGTTLSFLLWPFHPTTSATYKMCIMKNNLPSHVLKSSETSSIYCNEKNDGVLHMQVVFPQSGTWYITVDIKSHSSFTSTPFVFHAKTQACPNECKKHGSCVVNSNIGISYGSCICDYGYSGFLCSEYHSLDVVAVCLLTISNIAFVPGIVVACSRKFFPEAVVYLFNMYCSTVYHACDSHGYCIYDYNTLQLSDFLASVLSVWFTLVTMVKLPALWHRTLNILAICCIFLGVQLSRFGLLIIAIPGGVGLLIVLISFGYRSHIRQKCFPRPKRCLYFLLPAFVLASTAVGIYTGLETTSNYKYLHSAWHIAIALCIPLLLPSVRKPKLYLDYNRVGLINDAESFRDSDESLLLNVRNTTDYNDTHEDPELNSEISFPRLVT